ncbi:MAG: copper resistance protein CopC [Hyphomonadaceae bacterium]
MKRLILAIAIASMSLTVAPAFAHTSVRETSIVENASLATSPQNFTVSFSSPTALANVTLTDASGQLVALDYTPSHTMATSFTIPLPRLAPGAYTLAWRTMAHDGHAMPGAIHFTITG